MTHCDQCNNKFTTVFRRKHLCDLCNLYHCNDCLVKISPAGPSSNRQSVPSQSPGIEVMTQRFISGLSNTIMGNDIGVNRERRHCRKCQVFTQWPVNVEAVSALRVKDLRYYLSRHHISATTCKEKSELICLVVNQIRKYRQQQEEAFHRHKQQNTRSSTSYRHGRSPSAPSAYSSNTSQSFGQQTSDHFTAPPKSTVVRDDGIRVQGMSHSNESPVAHSTYTDDIRVFPGRAASTEEGASGESSPSLTDDYVVVNSVDVLSESGGTPAVVNVTRESFGRVTSSRDDEQQHNEEVEVSPTPNITREFFGRGPSQSSNSSNSRDSEAVSPNSVSIPESQRQQTNETVNDALENRTNNETSHNNDGASVSVSQEVGGESNDAAALHDSNTVHEPPIVAPSPIIAQASTQDSITLSSNILLNEVENISLDNLPDEDSVRKLSVRQCKVLLAKHRVTASSILERNELLERVLTLWRSHNENKLIGDEVSDKMLCKICMEAPIDCVLLECSHMVCCTDCGRRLSECPICRQYVVRCVHTFFA